MSFFPILSLIRFIDGVVAIHGFIYFTVPAESFIAIRLIIPARNN